MPIEAKTKNKKKKKRKKVLRDGQISEVFSKSQTGGSPRGVSVPFQNRPVFLCSHKFSLFVPCPTYLAITPPPPPHHHHQHLLVVSFPTTSLRSLIYFSFVPLFPQTPRSPSRLSFLKNQNTSFPINARPYLILVKTNSDISPIFIFCK